MSLPSPNLDDRSFQNIVDDVKRQIGLRCPEWTEHNVSDPGVTLIELFAYMTEMALFRMNQVPEKNYIKFLEMLGVSLEPPAPARTDLLFELTRAIEDTDGEEAFETNLRARETVAATTRTENEDAIEFSTDSDLRFRRPRLRYVLAMPTTPGQETDDREIRPFALSNQGLFNIFGATPQQNDSLYLGFEADVSQNLIEVQAESLTAAATGLDESYPSQRWEVWNGGESRWDALDVIEDTTFGFNRTGAVQLLMPSQMEARQVGEYRAFWVRVRYTTSEDDLPPREPDKKRPALYQRSPEITAPLRAVCRGGLAPSSNSTTIQWEELGQSDGTPGQVFTLRRRPVLPRRAGETLLVGEQGAPISEMTEWTEVADFSESTSADRHFVCDSHSGDILLGPNIEQPDSSAQQHGAIPAKGLTLMFSSYRYGGGTIGNVKENQVRVLKSSIPYIAGVRNLRRADGGRNAETLERAKMRGRALLRRRDRAVTSEDYENLARQASSGVGRARCVQPGRLHSAGAQGENIPPGVVRVLLVPALSEAVENPRPDDLRVPARTRSEVYEYLDERRLLTTVLEVGEPQYVWVSTDITLVADPRADAEQVARRVRERLTRYLHPLLGGPTGDGWPFGRHITLSDIYAQVGAERGVAFLLDAKIFVSRVASGGSNLLGPEQPVSNADGVRLAEGEMVCSREHTVHVRPMWAVGSERGSDASN